MWPYTINENHKHVHHNLLNSDVTTYLAQYPMLSWVMAVVKLYLMLTKHGDIGYWAYIWMS